MIIEEILQILSSCFGFVAAIYFCIGSIYTGKKTIKERVILFYGYNPKHVEVATSQAIQYSIGALFLFASFLLQVILYSDFSTSQTTLDLIPQFFCEHIFFFHLLIVLILLLISGFLCTKISKWQTEIIKKELDKEQKNEQENET